MTPLAIQIATAAGVFALIVGAGFRMSRARDFRAYAADFRAERDRLSGLLAKAYAEKRRTSGIRAALMELDDAFDARDPLPIGQVVKTCETAPRYARGH